MLLVTTLDRVVSGRITIPACKCSAEGLVEKICSKPEVYKISNIMIIAIGLAYGTVAKAELPEQAIAAKQAAVQLAREGKVERALAALTGLSQKYPDDLGLIYDRIVILSEAGKSREALALFDQLKAPKAPVFVIRAVVNACRELKETDFALKLVDAELAKDPTKEEWRIRRAQLLVDKGDGAAAAKELDGIKGEGQKHPDWLDLRILAAKAAEDWDSVSRFNQQRIASQTEAPLQVMKTQLDAWLHLEKYDEALQVLQSLAKRFPEDTSLVWDRAVVLARTGKNPQALELFKKMDADAAPDYVIRAAVGSCRELKETDFALKLVNSRLSGDPENVEWRIRRAQLLVDQGKAVEAAEELEKFREVRSKNPDWLDVRIYAAQVARDWMAVLRYSEEKLKGQPDEPDLSTLGLKADALVNLGAAHAAERLLQDHPDLRTASRTIDLLERISGVELRWSGFASLTMAERQERAERVFKRLEDFAGDARLPRDLASLRVLALHNANRWQEAVDAYQALREQGELDANITAAVAGSYLGLKEPERACELYREAMQQGSTEESTVDGLFYSLVEMEDFFGARDLVERLINTEPPWRSYSGTPSPVGNGRRLDLEMTAVNAHYFADQLNRAWQGIDRLSRAAPGNRWLARMRASIALARGWRHQALNEFNIEAALNPDSVEALVGVAQSQLQMGDYQKAESRLLDLEKTFPENPAVNRLRRDWQVHEMADLWTDFRFMRSQGPELDGDGVLATAEFYGAPLFYRWRPVVQGRYAWAEIIEGQSYLSHIGAGAEYRSPNWELLANGGYVESRLREDPVGQVRIAWNPDDHWRLTAEYSTFNLDTPLRALWYGIAADRSGASLAYRWHESRQLSMRLARADFTDGNERWEAGASLRQRLVDIPHLDVDGIFNVYGSQNTRGDAPYFNPEEDFSLSLGLDAEHILWRRYDRTWVQRFIGELGNYDQKYYSTDWTGRLGYEQRLTLYPGWEMVAGVEGGRRVYDGAPEPFFGFNILIHARF